MGNRAQVCLIIVATTLTGALLWKLQTRPELTSARRPPVAPAHENQTQPNSSPSPSVPLVIQDPPRVDMQTPKEPPESSIPPVSNNFVGTLRLIIPVAGVRPDQLLDTFADSRSQGRIHDAIDIPAAAGTPVLATADGEVLKLFHSDLDGITIYQLSADKKLIFYYAHLQGYADALAEGNSVHQGDVIGFVGDTGNAGPGNYHLHFSISITADPKRYWEGTNINPYPLLHR